jgi:hypothetical protein
LTKGVRSSSSDALDNYDARQGVGHTNGFGHTEVISVLERLAESQ